MTQILTVSATTAGYAMDQLKPQRVTRNTVLEENMRALVDKAAQGDDYRIRAFVNVVQPPALALYFLTMKPQNQATLQETLDAYLSTEA